MPPGAYKRVDIIQTMIDFAKLNVVPDDVTLKTSVKTKNILRFDEK